MKHQGIIWGLAIIVVIAGAAMLLSGNKQAATTTNEAQQQGVSGSGRVVFGITDAAADLGAVSTINMTVDEVSMHSNANGWITVANADKDFDLIALRNSGTLALAAEATIPAGSYDQVRVTIKKVAVVKKAGGTVEAKLPSGEFKYNANLVVAANATSSVSLDFLADASLHVTGNGTYIFAPVVRAEHRSNATVSVNSNNIVTIAGGRVDGDSTHGMDIDGSVKANFKIDAGAKVDINNGVIKVQLPAGATINSSSSKSQGGIKVNTDVDGGIKVGY